MGWLNIGKDSSDVCVYDKAFQKLKDAYGITVFDEIWAFPEDWIEPVNRRRGGWSGVSRHSFDLTPDKQCCVYLKRQQNQFRRGPLSAFAARPTFWFEKEMLRRINSCEKFGPDVLCYGERRTATGRQSFIVTRALDGYLTLDELVAGAYDNNRRLDFMRGLGRFLCRLHQLRVEHGALYAKHIYFDPSSLQYRLIDFERARFRRAGRIAMGNDLECLFRRAGQLTDSDKKAILSQYQLLPEFRENVLRKPGIR